jgi:Uma2 family endonuclease
MTDEEFAQFCAEVPDYFVETTATGEILIRPPNYSLASARKLALSSQLFTWAVCDGRGIATDSSGGFVLPNGARRAPDAAWSLHSRVAGLSAKEREGFWRLCPDFIIELRSQSDRLNVLRAKMAEWISNGAQLGWLVDPEREAVEIFRPEREPVVIEGSQSIAGDGPIDGFVLDLQLVWKPFRI